VLVSVSILLAIVAMLSIVFNEITRAWQKGEGRSERRRSARSLADFIAGELQGALLPVETLAKVPPSNLQFLINPPTSQISADFRNADAAFWQAPIATETSFGEVAEIGYFVKWMQTDAAPVPRPVLCRFFVNPSMQDSSGTIVQNPDFKIYDSSNADAWLTENLLNKVAPADKASGYVGLFAENVVGLWLRFFSLDGIELPKSLPKVFDSRKGYDLDVTYKDASGTEKTKTEKRYLPAVVTVSVAQIESRLAVRMDDVWESVRDLSRKATDAEDFVVRMQTAAEAKPALRPLLSGLRTYTTQVQLINGR
jgi:hypothetical protein